MEIDNVENQVRKSEEAYKELLRGGGTAKTKKSWWFRISKKRWIEDWQDLKASERVILLTLWLYAGKKDSCFPSERKVAEELKVGLKSVWRNVKSLEKKGFIRTEKLIGQNGKYNKYWLLK